MPARPRQLVGGIDGEFTERSQQYQDLEWDVQPLASVLGRGQPGGLGSSAFISDANDIKHQPAHWHREMPLPVATKLATYARPEQRCCPARMCEFVNRKQGKAHLLINAQNCVQRKTCEIEDLAQSIARITPEVRGGPDDACM